MSVKSDPRNVGKTVRFTIKRGNQRFVREGKIAYFRGRGKGTQAAYVTWQLPSGHFETASITLNNMEYV